MWTGGGNHGRMLMNLILTPLNVFNIGLSSFTLLLFIVVRCPVTYQKLVDNGYGKARAMFYTSLDPMTIYYFIYTVLARAAKGRELPNFKGSYLGRPRGRARFRVCSSLLLLDIVVKDPTSQDVINAIVYPRRQLGATALLGFFVVYIFALLIFQAYSDGFSYEDDPEGTGGSFPEDCRSLLRCMAVTMMYGLRLSGGIGDIMKHTWSTRLWIDFMYFLAVLIVLLNVIFGIIIDTFSDLRGQKGDRVFKTIHSCFICGVDDVDKDEDDGLELYVRQNIEMKDITWLPVGRAMCLDDSNDDDDDNVTARVAALSEKIDTCVEASQAQIMKSVETSSEHLRKFVEANQKKLEKRADADDRIAARARATALAGAKARGAPLQSPLRSDVPLDGSVDVLTVEVHGASDLVEAHLLGSGDLTPRGR
ncbi:inositol 1,4,5-trisphosphate-sensitive calcium-release channel [Aureococcus anophagefferens]|nr:inositol 1,4,5-trisphosphate-sensitive calcium-release channel [Aureococcus anophagefferens]